MESGSKANSKTGLLKSERKGRLLSQGAENDTSNSITSGETSRVSYPISHHQPLKAVSNNQTWQVLHNRRNIHKRGRSSVQRIIRISDNVAPSGDGVVNKGPLPRYDGRDVKKIPIFKESIACKFSTKTDSTNQISIATNCDSTLDRQGGLSGNLTSISESKNASIIKKCASNFRPFSYIHPKANRTSKANGEGIVDKAALLHDDQQPNIEAGNIAPNLKTKSNRTEKQQERSSPASGGDHSRVISTSSLENSCECSDEAGIDLEKGGLDNLLMPQICSNVETSKCELSSAPTERRLTVQDVRFTNLESKDNMSSLTPIDEVDTLTTITDESATSRLEGCERDKNQRPELDMTPTFRSQNFVHFSTAITLPARREMIQITPGLLHKVITPKLAPYGRASRCIPFTSTSRMPRQRADSQAAQESGVVAANGDQSFNRKQLVKRRFFLHESANLEDILADTGDRRIVAICNKFHCEMLAFSKVPRKGSMKHEVILLASCKEDIARCARCLDARLNWCISPQLD